MNMTRMARRLVDRISLPHLLLLAILLLAAALRLTRLDLAEFKADEAGIQRQALALLQEGHFPVVGPGSSQGPAHPPLQIYLLALPLAFSRDPRAGIAVVALIHTAAVGMTYLLGARFFKRRVGLIAAFFFAVNPWAIYYARKMWTQNWPLATTLFITSLLLLLQERRPWALAGAFVALVALTGTHLGGLVFVGVLLLVLLLFPSRVRRRPLLVGALIFSLCALPYLYHDATHGWANLRGFLDLGGGPAQIDLQAARFAAWLSSGYHYQDLAGARHQQFLAGLPDLRWLDVAQMALLGLGLLYLLARLARHARGGRERWDRAAGREVALLSWLLIPVLLQTRHTRPVYPHYFILLYPVQFLVVGLFLNDALDWLGRRLDRRAAAGLAAGLLLLVGAIGAWQLYLEQRFVRFVARYDTPGGYGPVVGPLWRTATRAGARAQDAGGAEILVLARGDDPLWDNRPAALDVLLPREPPHRLVDAQTALVYPLRPAIYVTTPDAEPATQILQAQPGAEPLEQIDGPGENVYRLFRRDNASRDDVLADMTPLEPSRRLANDVVLLAYRLEGTLEAGEVVEFRLAWWLDGPPPPGVNYHLFAHLVDGTGRRRGQHDLASFPTPSWQAGDLVVTRFRIPIADDAPAGDYWVNVGMYSYPDVVNVPVLDPAGNPVADFVAVGPLPLRR